MIKIKKLFTASYADENIIYFDQDSANVVFNFVEMSILDIDFNNINLDSNFDVDDPDTINHVTLLAWYIKLEKRKEFKKKISE